MVVPRPPKIRYRIRVGLPFGLASHVLSQCDLRETSGLRTIVDLIRTRDLPVPIIEFTHDDIVRSGVCAMWVRAFDEARI